jgi:hypothetical protein
MNQKFPQTQGNGLTHAEVGATGVTLGEHNRQLRDQAIGRILLVVTPIVFFLIGVLVFIAG